MSAHIDEQQKDYIKSVKAETNQLALSGRWAEAFDTTINFLNQPPNSSLFTKIEDLCSLVYTSGEPPWGNQIHNTEKGEHVQHSRRRLCKALLLANRGIDRQSATMLAMESLNNSKDSDPVLFWYAITLLIYAEEVEFAEHEVIKAKKSARWSDVDDIRDSLAVLQARLTAFKGNLQEARKILSEVNSKKLHPRLSEISVAWHLEILAELAESEEAKELLHVHTFPGPIANIENRPAFLSARGSVELSVGRFERALEDFLACGRELTRLGVFNPAVTNWRSKAALCATTLDQKDLAIALSNEELRAARKWGTPWIQAMALHSVALSQGDERTVHQLREATSLLTHSQIWRYCAKLYFDFGTHLSEIQLAEEASDMLATSKRVAHQCGNSFWSSRADQALNGPNHASTSAKLTPQEKRVARLAKTGMSNNEIADQMYITVGAVEQHLSKVFKKRNISNRRDLSYAVICCD